MSTMDYTTDSLFWLTVVGALWGSTNPFLKKGSAGIETVESSTPILQFFKEILFLLTNWKYMVPFLLNQSGSLIYFLTLQNTDVSLAVPVANSLTFVFTMISGCLLGEERPHFRMLIGTGFVLLGISMCVFDKTHGL